MVERNTASRNGDDGIDSDAGSATLTGNTANFNADLGIEAVAGVPTAAATRRAATGTRPSARASAATVGRVYWPGRGSDEVSTTSKSLPRTRPRPCRSSLSQPRDGAPLMYQGEPLSASSIP